MKHSLTNTTFNERSLSPIKRKSLSPIKHTLINTTFNPILLSKDDETKLVRKCLFTWVNHVQQARTDKSIMIQNWTLALHHWQHSKLIIIIEIWRSKTRTNKMQLTLNYSLEKLKQTLLDNCLNVSLTYNFT